MAAGIEHPVLISTLVGIEEPMKHVFYTWVAMAILFISGFTLRGRMKVVPSGFQNVMEVHAQHKLKLFKLCGIFLFVLVQNLLGLVPGCDAPTANINTNAAMAVFVFLYYNFVGLRAWGPGYIKHFMGPMLPLAPLMLPIELISHVARPLSLTLRLFGNIRGEEIVLLLFFIMAPIGATLPAYFLFFIAKVLQAFIFYMLTAIYLQGAMEHAH